nr:hypothetical protein [Tanacetum cinerariifolium]
MILESIEHGPLIWPTVEENGVIRTKKYTELSVAEKIQADCDIKATSIILQGLPADIYSLVNYHRVAKDLWKRVQLLMQGTSLTKQEKECKLYDAFDKFTHIKGDSLHTYYLRFTQLINDMNIYKMKMKQFQVNTKFLNSLPPEWSSGFVVPVFSPRDDSSACLNKAMAFLTAIASLRVTVQQVQRRQWQNYSGEGHMARQCTQPKRPRNAAWYKEKAMLAEAQEAGQILDEEQLAFLADPGIPAAVLMANISNYGFDVISEEKPNKEQNNESITAELERYKERGKTFEQRINIDLSSREKMIDSQIDDIIKEKLALKEKVDSLEQNLSKQIKEKECLLETFNVFQNESKEKEKNMENKIDLEKKIKELDNIVFKVGQSAKIVHMLTKPQSFYDNVYKQALGYQNLFYLKKAQRMKPTLYDGIVISKNRVAMPVIDDEETLILEKKSR